MICHYCQTPTTNPVWVMGEPACPDCRTPDAEADA